MKQQRMAIVNDITGFGRCSTTVELPLVSAMKIQVCPLPTAILSAHTGFNDYYMDDYTAHMRPYIENWQRLNLYFDGILTGFLGSEGQIDIVLEFIKKFKKPAMDEKKETLLIVDPVMGDGGRLYSSYTYQLCRRMKELVAYADVLTPNLTEACNLLDVPYPHGGSINNEDLLSMCGKLAALRENADKNAMKIIITGIERGKNIGNFIYENGRSRMLEFAKIGSEHSGTGDVFVAIVAASLLKNETTKQAVAKAAEFVSKCLIFTETQGIPRNEGICFEEYLTELK
ncbi:pyridoxamine kinase [Pectinatus haikarae]|uniref:pyridoxal kinase n=1 Tax=Pectinatus haikarae TaxID=349096 RepID=A0ABT9Y5Q1_9FIRM|nr:pyridoxamine kinase [Pectinatus haikarae]MDQ0203164.1 pyridoxine kinase [Pectinatus haikarae]